MNKIKNRNIGKEELDRVNWVLDHIGRGKHCLEEYRSTFNRGANSFYADRRKALDILKGLIETDVDKWKRDLTARLEEVYSRSLDNPRTLNTALNALQMLAKLNGAMDDTLRIETAIPVIKWDKSDGE